MTAMQLSPAVASLPEAMATPLIVYTAPGDSKKRDD
jgi:hypothetical protein